MITAMYSYQYFSFAFNSSVTAHQGGLGKCIQVLFLVILWQGKWTVGQSMYAESLMKVWWRVWFILGPHKLLQCF